MSTLDEVIEKLEKTKALLYGVELSGIVIDCDASGLEAVESTAHLFYMAQEMVENVIADIEHWRNNPEFCANSQAGTINNANDFCRERE